MMCTPPQAESGKCPVCAMELVQAAGQGVGGERSVSIDAASRRILGIRTEEAKPYIDRAKVLFKEIQEVHPGSPWAARAAWELRRGFGVDLHPDYHAPYKTVSNPIPVPKL